MAGVGSSCSNAFRSWSPLSDFTEDDLNFLRGTLNDDYDKSGDKTRDGDSLMKNETFVGGGNNETSINESATVYSSAAAIILLTVTGIALM